jgi:hypothetical protein
VQVAAQEGEVMEQVERGDPEAPLRSVYWQTPWAGEEQSLGHCLLASWHTRPTPTPTPTPTPLYV